MRFLITILRKVYCWVWVNFFKSVNIWQLQTRTWLFRALRAPGQHAVTPTFEKIAYKPQHRPYKRSMTDKHQLYIYCETEDLRRWSCRYSRHRKARKMNSDIFKKCIHFYCHTNYDKRESQLSQTNHARDAIQSKYCHFCTKVAFEKVYNNHSHGLRLWTNWYSW